MNTNQTHHHFHHPLTGGLIITTLHNQDTIAHIAFNNAISSTENSTTPHPATTWLHAYCNNQQPNPQTLNLTPHGTPFQQRVWHALTQIPYGSTLTYGDLAHKLNTSPRAIGNACRRNPIPIIIPCHRITGKNNAGGYAGTTKGTLFNLKMRLITFENS